MRAESKTEIVPVLERSRRELEAVSRAVENEMDALVRAFQLLAGHADTILKMVAAIVGRVEGGGVSSVLPQVQALGGEAKRFLGERLKATIGIVETVSKEVQLLRQLSRVASSQEAIALEIKALSVLTNIEVARLGNVGAGFQYLARELADFSQSVIKDTHELASHTDGRREAIDETRRVLLAELPRLREDLARIEVDLGKALAAVDASLTQLSLTPAQFRIGVQEIAQQIAAVVSAIQSHDINRQMNEHVMEGLGMICAAMRGLEEPQAGDSDQRPALDIPQAHTGLTIQIYQLRIIQETVANWSTQIKSCTGGILRVSTSEVMGIGPTVLEQERKLSSQLGHIEVLERESQVYSVRIQTTLGGLSHLKQLVGEHLQRSKSVRHRLKLLALNSIVEASHLGTQADAILAISGSIRGISASWSDITDQSMRAMDEIGELVGQTNQVLEVFSEASNQRLREAQEKTRAGLENLRTAAEFAAGQAQEMQGTTEKMQNQIAEVGRTSNLLDSSFGRGDAVLANLEGLHREWKSDPRVKGRYDEAEMERMFGASYTTEMEREILRAALRGTPPPAAEKVFAGNSAELF
jgi:hypothetical protein